MSMQLGPWLPSTNGRDTERSAAVRVAFLLDTEKLLRYVATADHRAKQSRNYRTIRPRTQVGPGDGNENAFRVTEGVESSGVYRISARRCATRHGGTCSLFLASRVAPLELVDAAACVQHLLLAGVERVRGRGDVDLDHGIFVAVLPFDGLVARHRRTRQEREIGRGVLENHRLVVRMGIGFHDESAWIQRLRARAEL